MRLEKSPGRSTTRRARFNFHAIRGLERPKALAWNPAMKPRPKYNNPPRAERTWYRAATYAILEDNPHL